MQESRIFLQLKRVFFILFYFWNFSHNLFQDAYIFFFQQSLGKLAKFPFGAHLPFKT